MPPVPPLVCDCCKKTTDTTFLIKVQAIGEKEVCAECYLRMLPDPDSRRRVMR